MSLWRIPAMLNCRKDPWATLSMVTKESKFDDLLGMIVEKATPLPHVEKLHGQKIEITGYIIALAAKNRVITFYVF